MDLPLSKPRSNISCPKCGYENLPEKAGFCPECDAALITVPKPVPTPSAAHIEVTQEVGTVEGGQLVGVDLGEVLGDVSIGNYTLRIGTLNGGVVNLAPPQHQQQPPRARPAPVRLTPRKFRGLLDRKQETSIATSILLSASPAEFHGPPGIGKTALLRHLAHQHFDSAYPGGVVYLSAVRHRPLEDVLLDLFDAFYEREATYKPTAVQLRHALQDKQALLILEDVDLERHEVTELMDAAPECTFLLASTECCLWGEGRALALRGLPLEDALVLMERELGRSLRADERPVAEELCAALEGHPLSLLQLAALVRDVDRSLLDLSSQLKHEEEEEEGSPAKALTEQALSACSEQEKQILAVLAISRGATLGREHVSALTGIEDIDIPIESLKRRKLAQSHSPRYSLTGFLGTTLVEEWDLTPWNEQALEHFAAWAEQHRQNPQHVAEETDAILEILGWALQEGRWEGALRLGRAVEGALAVGGHWGAWAQVLGWQFQAARELGDRSAQGWALHQSGTRGLCLEHPSTAQSDLSEALRIRESLGDWAGAAVTRHNLEVFFGGPGGTSGPQGDGNGSGGGGGGWLPRLPLWQWLIGVVTAVVTLGLSSSALFSVPLALGSNDLSSNNSPEATAQWVPEWVPEPVAQWVLQPAMQALQPTVSLVEPAVQLLKPAMQALQPTVPPTSPNPEASSSTPSSKLDPSSPGGSSDSNPSDDSGFDSSSGTKDDTTKDDTTKDDTTKDDTSKDNTTKDDTTTDDTTKDDPAPDDPNQDDPDVEPKNPKQTAPPKPKNPKQTAPPTETPPTETPPTETPPTETPPTETPPTETPPTETPSSTMDPGVVRVAGRMPDVVAKPAPAPSPCGDLSFAEGCPK